jgi:invasion protein IalB
MREDGITRDIEMFDWSREDFSTCGEAVCYAAARFDDSASTECLRILRLAPWSLDNG